MRLIEKLVFARDVRPRRRDASRADLRLQGVDSAQASIVEAVAAHSKAGRYGDALALVDSAVADASDRFDLLFARASVLFSWWRYAEAYEQLIAIRDGGSSNAAFDLKLGWTCYWLNRLDEAEGWMRLAVTHAPGDWATHFGRGIALRARKRPAAAIEAFERVLALKPDDAHSISNLVACDIELGHLDRAERYAQSAVARDPASSSATVDLAIALCEQAQYADAVAAFERADSLGFSGADARDESVNYSICLLRAGRAEQANRMIESKLQRYPSAALHAHYALALLTSGRMREGWDHYEFRWLQEPLSSWRPKFVKPVWAGQDLRGKTILLRAEQGYGDFIQFIRYARHIKELGPTVLLEVREELRALAETAPGVDRILRSGEPVPPFDCYINLLSIPRIVGTDVDSIPDEVPYLRATPDRVARWKDTIRSDGVLNVGIVWAGSSTHLGDRFRSLSLRALAPLREIAGVRFHSLQKGPAAHELVTDCGHDPIANLGPELATFADTAAVIERLDLLISVDTSVVHLAGALGKPVWTLVAIPGDWRWLEDRTDSPWYPTMRLFRQREPGSGWDEVMQNLKTALEREAERHRCRVELAPAPPRRTPSRVSLREPVAPLASGAVSDLCRVTETRTGIMMYSPRDATTGTSIEFYGECLHLQFERVGRLLTPGMTALEVGAGIGVHSIPMAAALGEKGHLFLYENNGFLKQILHENLKANGISNVTVMRRSLAPGTSIEQDRFVGERSVSGVPASEAAEGPRSETIDELGLERLHLLKINESADAKFVVEGAITTLRRCRPRVFVAVSQEQALEGIASCIRDLRFACWKVEAPMFNPANFNGRDVDVFEGRRTLALLAAPPESAQQIDTEGFARLA
jgi:tetratricopeptide (TPR) repeat protein